MNDWDPIDIRDVPQAKDEYDRYVATVADMVLAGKSAAELSNYLLEIEAAFMGLKGDPGRARVVADKLRSIAR